MAAKYPPSYLLVRWEEEDSISVMPATSLKKNVSAVVGQTVPLKYRTKYYDAEILKISGELYINFHPIGYL